MTASDTASAQPCIDDSATNQSVEAELVREAVAGSASAARELVRLFHRPIFAYVSRMTGQAQDAEDITQETFVKAFRSLDRVDTNRPLIRWLFTIAHRTALNHFRSRKPWVELPREAAAPEAGPRKEAEQHELITNVWAKARRVLSAREYEIMWLRFGEELSTAEAASAAGVSISQVKTLVYRARQRLLTGRKSLL